jgi:tetratricopeptide (TPR) repeat protein
MDALPKRVIFDTNVLLTEPTVLLSEPDAQIIIPETVLGELDKLKTARVDPDLRFRGREVSRLIFELADGGSLIEGITLPDGGSLRVQPFDPTGLRLPDGFSTKTPDDKILATAYLLSNDEESAKSETVLVTNDLNLLLKAQTYGIAVQQYGKGNDVSFGKRYIVRPFQRYRVPLTILGVSLAVFAAVLLVANAAGLLSQDRGDLSLSSEVRSLLTASQEDAFNALVALKNDPQDAGALQTLGNFYYDRSDGARVDGDLGAMITDAKTGISYYERYLAYQPSDLEARNNMATLYFYSGDTDRAIQEVARVLEEKPNDVTGNLNLGTYYLFGRRDLEAAKIQMEKVVSLTEHDNSQRLALQRARDALVQIEHEMASAEGTETVGAIGSGADSEAGARTRAGAEEASTEGAGELQ